MKKKKKQIDPDRPLTKKELESLGPWYRGIDELPPAARKAVMGSIAKRGRPPVEQPKEKVTIRLDADILASLRASGAGWQTRLNDALRLQLK